MTLTSLSFFLFLPICILIFFLIKARYRYIWLLFCSYFFYAGLSSSFTTLLIFSTLITWITGNLIYNADSAFKKRAIMFAGLIINIAPLLIFKYGDFFLSLTPSENRLNLILPVGISFYTFQSLTYIFDCYNKKCEPEKNIFKYALFVSFFPLILSGPIERASRLLKEFDKDSKFDTVRAKDGLKQMLFGYFVKMVIVSRLTLLTNAVFVDYLNKSTLAILIAIFAYSIQIYADFSSYSNIAIGMCKIMDINIMKNFSNPYFAVSVSDFWRRWHISLSTWFRDYLYIPLGGNRKGKVRKYINLMIVFLVSGLWHGANLTFVLWGFLNGFYQIVGDLLKPVKENVLSKFADPLKNSLSKVCTFLLISYTWVFFRAPSIQDALIITKRIFVNEKFADLSLQGIYGLQLGLKNLLFVIIAIAMLIIADVICEKKSIEVHELLSDVKTPIRWGIYYIMIVMILLSMNLNMTEFIYSGF